MATFEPIASLAPNGEILVDTNPTVVRVEKGNSIMNLLVWFLVIAAIIWGLFAIFKPTWVQKKDLNGFPIGELDQSKAIIYALIISLLIVGILYVVKRN